MENVTPEIKNILNIIIAPQKKQQHVYKNKQNAMD